MKLVHEKTTLNQFTRYSADSVSIGTVAYRASVIVSQDKVDAWRPQCFVELQREDFAAVLAYQPELVLLGTGQKINFPKAALMQDLINAGIGVEVMDVGAVCRTFNALVGEGRRAVALILLA